MKKIIFIALIAYGLGGFGVGITRAVDNWDSMGTTSLLQDAVAHGALWPGSLARLVI